MNVIQKRYSKSKLLLICVIAGLIVIAGAGCAFVLRSNSKASADSATIPVAKPLFSFNTTAAIDWRKGPSNGTSMALFYKPNDCFVSAEYKTGTVDIAAVLQENQKDLESGGYTSTQSAIIPVTLETNAKAQQYNLHQYSVITPAGTNEAYAAHEFGYIQLSSGYIKIEGYCTDTDNLAATIPALQAIKFDEDH